MICPRPSTYSLWSISVFASAAFGFVFTRTSRNHFDVFHSSPKVIVPRQTPLTLVAREISVRNVPGSVMLIGCPRLPVKPAAGPPGHLSQVLPAGRKPEMSPPLRYGPADAGGLLGPEAGPDILGEQLEVPRLDVELAGHVRGGHAARAELELPRAPEEDLAASERGPVDERHPAPGDELPPQRRHGIGRAGRRPGVRGVNGPGAKTTAAAAHARTAENRFMNGFLSGALAE